MTIEIRPSSPKANAIREQAPTAHPQAMYPFEQLEVGQSFTAKLSEINWKSLRTIVYRKNREMFSTDPAKNRKFAFIKHDDLQLAEVARIK